MSYSISGSGHGTDSAKAKAAFADLVHALDEASAGIEGATKFSGTMSGGDPQPDGQWQSWSTSADAVRLADAESAVEPTEDTSGEAES